jgi:hypothetical protein
MVGPFRSNPYERYAGRRPHGRQHVVTKWRRPCLGARQRVFDSQLTTYKILDELSGRGIRWITLRQRGKTELARLDTLPASTWKTATIARSGRYRRPRLHEDLIKLTDVSGKVRHLDVLTSGVPLNVDLDTHPDRGSRQATCTGCWRSSCPGTRKLPP